MEKKSKKIVMKKLAKIEEKTNYQIIPTDPSYEKLLVKLVPISGFHKDKVYILEMKTRYSGNFFPFNAPKVKFLSKVYHSNVYGSGDICLDILKDKWSPNYNFDSILNSIILLLDDPNPNSAANGVAGKQEKKFKSEFKSLYNKHMTEEESDELKKNIYKEYIDEINKNDSYNNTIYMKYKEYFA